METEKLTGLMMCTLISEYFRAVRGINKTPEEIWHYSPTGELHMIYIWYDEAEVWKKSTTSTSSSS